MPAPQPETMSQLAKTFFTARQQKLPVAWQDMGDQYDDAFAPADRVVAPNSPLNLFREATLNKIHVQAAKTIGDKFEAFIQGMCRGICSGIRAWMPMARFTMVKVAAISAIGAPGCFTGPELTPLIMAGAPKTTPQETKYARAIAGAIGDGWKFWQDMIIIPGLPWYPAFAAVPSAQAPPTPNVPMPLITLPSAGEAKLAPDTLKADMLSRLADPTAEHAEVLFDAVSKAFSAVFLMFKLTTLVMNVMGQGPVPSFAPPFVPVSPVVGGDVLPTPGVLV